MPAICVHSTPGRLRIRSAAVKNSSPRADRMRSHLEGCSGVCRVDTNPLTGSVLVNFNPESASEESLLREVHKAEKFGFAQTQPQLRFPARRKVRGAAVAHKVARHITEQLAERLLVMLILAIAA